MNELTRNASPGEQRIAKKLIQAALNDGYTVSVSDGEEWTVRKSRDFQAIVDALATTDCDNIRLRDADDKVFTTIALIYGNDSDGSELIADYTIRDEAAVESFMRKHRLAGH